MRLGAVLHFLIAIGHIGCLFALDEAFEAYGILEIIDRKSTRLNSSHHLTSRMPSSA